MSATPVTTSHVAAACVEDHCVTCSDEARPMRVASLGQAGLATCLDERGVSSEVMVDLVGGIVEGDVLLVHAGVAIAFASRAERAR